MTNQKYFGELKANKRVKYLKNLPAAVELHDYLEALKEKVWRKFWKSEFRFCYYFLSICR